jgi:hypothetical protein
MYKYCQAMSMIFMYGNYLYKALNFEATSLVIVYKIPSNMYLNM